MVVLAGLAVLAPSRSEIIATVRLAESQNLVSEATALLSRGLVDREGLKRIADALTTNTHLRRADAGDHDGLAVAPQGVLQQPRDLGVTEGDVASCVQLYIRVYIRMSTNI